MISHYFNHALYPGILANKIQRIQMANSFAKNKDVKKVYFYFIMRNKKNLSDIKKNFHKRVILKPIIVPGYVDIDEAEEKSKSRKRFILPAALVYIKFFFIIMKKRFDKNDFCYIRGDAPVVAATIKRILTPRFGFMFEMHNQEFNPPYSLKDRFYCQAFKLADKIITVSEGTKSHWVKNNFDKNKIEVLPSGVDIAAFDKISENKEVNRKKLGLPINKKIVLYSGQLHDWKGVDTLIDSFSYNQSSVELYILGGKGEDIAVLRDYANKKRINNVTFLGNKPHELVAKYLKAADLLVLPNTAKNRISRIHTSPIKLLEYMASKTPIVASDLPSIRQIVSEKEVIFFQPDNPKNLHDKIIFALKNYKVAKDKSLNAYDNAKKYSWDERVKKIVGWFDTK